MRICIFCASRPGTDPGYMALARAVGSELGRRGHRLVYGGGRVGLMGALADAVLDEKAHVTGVIPSFLEEREVAHKGLSNLIVVDSMHERKAKMAEMADAFGVLPGGIGTLEELFEIWTWAQLSLHFKPIVLLNHMGYFDLIREMVGQASDQGFVSEDRAKLVRYTDHPSSFIDQLEKQVEPSRTTQYKRI